MASAFLAMLPPSAEAAVKNGDHFEDCVPYLVEIYGHQIIDVLLATASKP